jgi:hypothetical protein
MRLPIELYGDVNTNMNRVIEPLELKHLIIDTEVNQNEILTTVGFENKFNHCLKKLLSSTKLSKDCLNKISNVAEKAIGYIKSCNDIEINDEIDKQSIKGLTGCTDSITEFGSEYGYSDDIQEFETTLMNYKQWRNGFVELESASPVVFEQTLSTINNLIKSDPQIKSCFNFGVSYGNVDAELAICNPKVFFTGIDRSLLTKTLNDIEFGQSKNLKFVAGDVFKYLSENSFDGGIFFTTRTLMIFPEEFITKLYNAVRSAGFEYIVGIEPIGISRQTQEPYIFSYDNKPSVVYRNKMFIHNYPAILKNTGYALRHADLTKTGHSHKDFRLITFLAGKINPRTHTNFY